MSDVDGITQGDLVPLVRARTGLVNVEQHCPGGAYILWGDRHIILTDWVNDDGTWEVGLYRNEYPGPPIEYREYRTFDQAIAIIDEWTGGSGE
jgi:hypothetical protein